MPVREVARTYYTALVIKVRSLLAATDTATRGRHDHASPRIPRHQHGPRLPGRPDQIRNIRHDLRELLADCPAADSLILCASELATNAVLHSDSARPGGQLTVTTRLIPGRSARVAVSDQGGR
jgi:hypothetical protein